MNLPKLVILDVDYRPDSTVAAWILATGWKAVTTVDEGIVRGLKAVPYEPGLFYKRELPPILEALKACEGRFDTIVIDGLVWVGEDKPGLGAHLYQALDRRYPVVGIAKNPYPGALVHSVTREASVQPLYVSAIGCESLPIVPWVRDMYGPHRIPFLLKRVDRLCRDAP
jgi:deoxyribonuclease V